LATRETQAVPGSAAWIQILHFVEGNQILFRRYGQRVDAKISFDEMAHQIEESMFPGASSIGAMQPLSKKIENGIPTEQEKSDVTFSGHGLESDLASFDQFDNSTAGIAPDDRISLLHMTSRKRKIIVLCEMPRTHRFDRPSRNEGYVSPYEKDVLGFIECLCVTKLKHRVTHAGRRRLHD